MQTCRRSHDLSLFHSFSCSSISIGQTDTVAVWSSGTSAIQNILSTVIFAIGPQVQNRLIACLMIVFEAALTDGFHRTMLVIVAATSSDCSSTWFRRFPAAHRHSAGMQLHSLQPAAMDCHHRVHHPVQVHPAFLQLIDKVLACSYRACSLRHTVALKMIIIRTQPFDTCSFS